MKRKRIIKKLVFLAAWVLVGSGMIVLLAAANKRQKENTCKQVSISVTSDGDVLFIDKGDIAEQLRSLAKGSLLNKPVADINIQLLEKGLEKHSWIRDAELYVDSKDVLHVIVSERQPIARVFTTAGSSFYIDSAGHRMPLLNKVAVRVPLVSNFTNAKKLSSSDSSLLRDVKSIVRYINGDSFWSAQIAQIDITPDRNFELLPVVGTHIIRIGKADNFEQKFARLFLFYKQVLSKAGIDKYKVIDVQFDNQVIGMQHTSRTAIDSIQLQRNIAELIERSKKQAMQDSVAAVEAYNQEVLRDSAIKELMYSLEEREALEKDLPLPVADSAAVKPVVKKKVAVKPVPIPKVVSKPIKAKVQSKTVVKPKTNPKKKEAPKAVMQKRN